MTTNVLLSRRLRPFAQDASSWEQAEIRHFDEILELLVFHRNCTCEGDCEPCHQKKTGARKVVF